MRNTKIREPIVVGRSERILVGRGAVVAAPTRRVLVIEHLGPGVVDFRVYAAAKLLSGRQLQRVVIRNVVEGSGQAARDAGTYADVLRIGPPGLSFTQPVGGQLVYVGLKLQTIRVTAHVGRLCHKTLTKLALNAHRPLVDAPNRRVERHVRYVSVALSVVGKGMATLYCHVVHIALSGGA